MQQINLQQAKVAVIGAGTMGIGMAQKLQHQRA